MRETRGWQGFKNFIKDPTSHFSIGERFTMYGDNAMHWAVNFYTKRWGWFCFAPPTRSRNYWRPMYFYISPDGTPSKARVHWAWFENACRRSERKRDREDYLMRQRETTA